MRDDGARLDATVLITGTNRGIGLEFVRQYAEAGWTVIGTARDPARATELQALAAKHKDVSIATLDVADPASIAALAARLKGRPIDVLINNAGTLGDVPRQTIAHWIWPSSRRSWRRMPSAP